MLLLWDPLREPWMYSIYPSGWSLPWRRQGIQGLWPLCRVRSILFLQDTPSPPSQARTLSATIVGSPASSRLSISNLWSERWRGTRKYFLFSPSGLYWRLLIWVACSQLALLTFHPVDSIKALLESWNTAFYPFIYLSAHLLIHLNNS